MDLSFSLELPSALEKREEIPSDQELIIIGGGPAGFTAAVYAARAALKPLVLVGPAPGGQVATTERMENYPGFPEGIAGQALASLIQEQAEEEIREREIDYYREELRWLERFIDARGSSPANPSPDRRR